MSLQVTQVNAVRADMASRALKPVMGRNNITVGPSRLSLLMALVRLYMLGLGPACVAAAGHTPATAPGVPQQYSLCDAHYWVDFGVCLHAATAPATCMHTGSWGPCI
jgi:hypothetical protein